MSAGCTTCNIYNRHTVFTVKNVEDAHGSSNTLAVKSRPVVRRLKILRYASIHLYTCGGRWNQVRVFMFSRLELGAGNTETLAPSSAAGINPSCWKALNVAAGPAYYYDGALDRNTAQPCALVRNI